MVGELSKVAKRPKSSYIHYSNDKSVREEIKKLNPDWTVTQIASYLGGQWKSMDTKARQKWVDMYLKEKEELKENPIYVTKKKRKGGSVDTKTLDKRIDELEKVVNQLQNEVVALKHQIM